MSAIWGIVDLHPGETEEQRRIRLGRLREEAEKMRAAYAESRIDRIGELLEAGQYLACGVQYVTKEAALEDFPYGRREGQWLVADVILDNREQMQRLFPGETFREGCPDGEILYRCCVRDLQKTLKEALGAYACAWLRQEERELVLFSDAVGNRSVYYLQADGKIYFSTLLAGITHLRAHWECNMPWFDRFFSMRDLRAVAEARETPYRDIFRMEPGELLRFTPGGLHRYRYWDPLAARHILRGKTEAEYRELVTETFRACVEDVIRGDRETGILLSGGLDSNAVAAYAAPFLKKQGKRLYSFTSVPEETPRQIRSGRYAVEDERTYVELVQRYHGNIESAYLVTRKGDLLAQNRHLLELLEVPYKAVLNLPWMYESYLAAAEKGCGILLSGQYGNITISYGDFRCLFLTLLHRGRLPTLMREMNAYSRKYRKSRKWIWKDLLIADPREDFRCVARYRYDKNALRQVGEYEVKLSLATGVIPRDPTRDKRLIELVLSLPMEQFTHDGQERCLVRRYMRGKIPAEILEDEFHKGRQAVGSAELLEEQWEQIRRALPCREKAVEPMSREMRVRMFYSGLALEYQRRFER